MAATPSSGMQVGIHTLMLMSLFQQVVWIVLCAYFIFYFQHLESIRCKCATGWRNDVLRTVLIALIVLVVLRMYMRGALGVVLTLVEAALLLTFVIVSRQFLSKTLSMQCECAQVPAFRVLDIVNIIMIYLMVFGLLLSLTQYTLMAR